MTTLYNPKYQKTIKKRRGYEYWKAVLDNISTLFPHTTLKQRKQIMMLMHESVDRHKGYRSLHHSICSEENINFIFYELKHPKEVI